MNDPIEQLDRALIESAIRLSQVLERPKLYEAIRDLCRDVFSAEAVSVLVLDQRRGRWEYRLAYNQLCDRDELPPLAYHEGLAGWVAAHREPVIIRDSSQDGRLRHLVDRKLGFAIRSVLATPIYRGEEVIGVLEVLNSTRPEGFDERQLDLLGVLGMQFSVSLENARLVELLTREKRENQLLNRVGLELASTLSLQDLLPLLVELLGELIRFEAVGIYLHRRQSGMLEWFYGRGYPPGSEEQVRLKIGQGAVGWVAENRQTLVLSDVRSDPRYLDARPATRSEMTVPLQAGGDLVGVFNLESDDLDAYSERDLNLLAAFGNQAAIAIQRAWFYDETIEKRRLEEEVRIGRRIQRRLLPEADPQFEGLDVAAFNQPSLQVSGDLFDFILVSEDQLGMMVGDVVGKGIPAGLLMASLRASLRAEIRNNYSIATILMKVNRLMWESSELEDFVTVVYGVLDRTTGRLTYANAGHEPPLLLRSTGEVEWLETGGTVVGSFPDVRYEEGFVQLAPGDLLAFYTDGITDAASVTDEPFGRERLVETLRARTLGAESSRQICRRLLDAVHAHCGQVHVEDDLTAIILQAREIPRARRPGR